MKVLHLFKTYYTQSKGGLEQAIYQLTKAQARLGVRSTVLTTQFGEGEYIDDPMIDEIRCKTDLHFSSIAISREMFQTFNKIKDDYDVINFHHPFPMQDLMNIFYDKTRPIICTYHSDIMKRRALQLVFNPVLNRSLSKVDRIVATSKNYIRSSPVLSKFNSKTVAIPLGIDEDFYPEVTDESRRRVDEITEERFVLFVGVLRYYKGLEYLIQEAKDIPAKVIIAGAGPQYEKVQSWVEEYQATNVILLGYVDEDLKMALYEKCKCLVMPSHLRAEAYGLSLVESAMMGKPMVSTEIETGTSFVNLESVTGFVVPPRDSNALKQKITQILGDPMISKRFSANARERYEKLFTGKEMAQKYLDLYENLSG